MFDKFLHFENNANKINMDHILAIQVWNGTPQWWQSRSPYIPYIIIPKSIWVSVSKQQTINGVYHHHGIMLIQSKFNPIPNYRAENGEYVAYVNGIFAYVKPHSNEYNSIMGTSWNDHY